MTKVNQISQYPSENKNYFSEIQNNADKIAIYEEANHILRPIPYAQNKKVMYQFAKIFSAIYHPFSFLTALATTIMLALIFSGLDFIKLFTQKITTMQLLSVFVFILVFLLITYLLGALEWTKAHYSNNIYKNKALKENNKSSDLFYLVILTSISIVTSIIGGSAITYLSSDKSVVIQENNKQKNDSLHHYFEQKIMPINKSIERLEELQNTSVRRWGLTSEETQQLNALRNERRELNTQKRTQLNDVRNEYNKSILQNTDWTGIYVWVAGFVILCLELLNLRAYQIKFSYLTRVQLEGFNLGITNKTSILSVENKKTEVKTKKGRYLLGIRNKIKTKKSSLPPTPPITDKKNDIETKKSIIDKEEKNEKLNINIDELIAQGLNIEQIKDNLKPFNKNAPIIEVETEEIFDKNERNPIGFNFDKNHSKSSSNAQMNVNKHKLNDDKIERIELELNEVKNKLNENKNPIQKANERKKEKEKNRWKCTEIDLQKAFKNSKIKTVTEGQIYSGMSRGKVAEIRKKVFSINE